MKKLIAIATVVFLFVVAAPAQVRIGVNVNIGAQPVWGPAGYDYAEYYYLPDIDVYYYVPRREFIYLSGGRWIYSPALPPWYRNYDLYSGYKVVLNEPRPYLRDYEYRERYGPYRGRHGQAIIRDNRGYGYHHDNGNHYGWNNHHDNGNHYGWDKHREHGRHHDRD